MEGEGKKLKLNFYKTLSDICYYKKNHRAQQKKSKKFKKTQKKAIQYHKKYKKTVRTVLKIEKYTELKKNGKVDALDKAKHKWGVFSK